MPLFDIPAPPAYKLSNAPLAQALAQVRFPLIADFESMTGIAPLQRELRAEFPYMQQEKVQEVSFVAGPAGGSSNAAESVNWHFTNDSDGLIVVGAGGATLSIGESYSGVEDFKESFRRLVEALAKVGVPRCDRLGVRYLSIAPELPTAEQSWRQWFKPEVMGWPGAGLVAQGVAVSSVTQTQLTLPSGDLVEAHPGNLHALVRHGAVPPETSIPGMPLVKTEAPSYFLDLDVFFEGHQRFDPRRILDQFAFLHGEIDRFFYWSLTKEGARHFGLSIDDG